MDNVHQHPAIQIFQLKLLRRKPAVTPSQGPTASVAAAAAAPPAPASAEAAVTTAAIHSNAGSPRTAGTSAVAGNVSSATQQGLEAQSQHCTAKPLPPSCRPAQLRPNRLPASLQASDASHPDEEAYRPASDATNIKPVNSGILAMKLTER